MNKDLDKLKGASEHETSDRSDVFEDVPFFYDDTSKYGSLKNELMHAMFRFKSVGRRSRNIGFGDIHKHGHHHSHGRRERGGFHEGIHGSHDVNPGELMFLKQIHARKSSGDCSGNWLSSMSDCLHISKAAVSQMLGALEKKGFITRETNPDNRREIIVSLTKEGEKRMDEIQRSFDEKTDMLIERFGVEDTKELIRLVNKMTEIIGEVDE